QAEALHILREATVASRREGAACGDVRGELRGIGEIKSGIFRERDQSFRRGGQRAAKNRLVDEVHTEARRVLAGGVRNVVAELIFLLVAQYGERRDGGDELIVAEGFEARDGAGR